MSAIGEAWGFRLSQDVEYRKAPRSPWARGKIVRFDIDKTIWVKDLETTKTIRIANPKAVRVWQPPNTLADIERFLES